jgi:hypothetical protein
MKTFTTTAHRENHVGQFGSTQNPYPAPPDVGRLNSIALASTISKGHDARFVSGFGYY